MSDVLPDLPRPARPEAWRDRLAGWAESLDLSPARLVGGAVMLAMVGFLGWRLLAPPPTPPEMRLPFVSTTGPAAAPGEAPEAASSAGAAGSAGSDDAASTTVPDGAELVVHVAGAVARSGVQRLPAGSRVVDAVEAAGGAAADADPSRINLAAPLEDGQQVYVPRLGEVGGGAGVGPGGAGGGAGGAGAGAESVVNLNTADVDQLDALPGVGPAIAQAIVDYRDQNGPFATVDQLVEVRGIGDAKLADLRDRVTV
jgi:competence protein ComEA